MKSTLKLFCTIMFLSLFGTFYSYSQDLSLNDQQEIVRNDADYKTLIDNLKKSKELAVTNYFGELKLDSKSGKQPSNKEELIEYLHQSGVKHPEEFVQLQNDLSNSMSRLVKKHDFLKERSKEELKIFFKGLLEKYRDAGLGQEYLFNAIKQSKKN